MNNRLDYLTEPIKKNLDQLELKHSIDIFTFVTGFRIYLDVYEATLDTCNIIGDLDYQEGSYAYNFYAKEIYKFESEQYSSTLDVYGI